MKLIILDPASSVQEITVEDIDKYEVDILKAILEVLELEHDYFQIHKNYTNKIIDLLIFDKLRKDNKNDI